MILDRKNPNLVKKYNDFVRNSQYGRLEQDIRRANIKNNRKSVYFYREVEGEISAALSIIYIEDFKVKSNFFYAPRGPVCDPYDLESISYLLEEAQDFAMENGGFLLRLDPEIPYSKDLDDLYRERGLIFRRNEETSSQPLMSLVLELKERNLEEILASFSKNTRKHIRHSYKTGLYTKREGRESLGKFYDMICIMSERAGINHRPYDYFERLFDNFKDQMNLSFTYYEDIPLACSMLIGYGNKCFSIYGASNNEYRNMDQNYQINFEEIKFCIERGYKEYDMGGIFSTDPEDGLYSFKRKFTGDNVVNRIGELDLVLEEEKYQDFMGYKNPHSKRLEGEK